MTDITLPEQTGPSKLHRDPAPVPYVDDVIRADDRIRSFRTKYKTGRIVTTIAFDEGEDTETWAGSVIASGVSTFTVRADVYTDAHSVRPAATAHATRSSNDPDPVTAARPQETAETAAVSRALRYLGIRLLKG